MSDSQRPPGLQPTRFLCPWDFPSKNTRVGCHFLFQEIFPTQGLNPGLPPCRQTLNHLSHQQSERWTINKAEHRRIDDPQLWCWRRLLRVPWTARRSNQSVPKEISSEIFIGRIDAEAEALVLWSPDVKSQLIGTDLDAGKG